MNASILKSCFFYIKPYKYWAISELPKMVKTNLMTSHWLLCGAWEMKLESSGSKLCFCSPVQEFPSLGAWKETPTVNCRNEAWIPNIQASFFQPSEGFLPLPHTCREGEILWQLAAACNLPSGFPTDFLAMFQRRLQMAIRWPQGTW